jgi:SAM-dependent methyltransferase
MAIEDREKIRTMYDGAAEKEWERLERDPRGRVAFEVHRRFLARYLRAGQHVLEIGAGPGRFTFVLAELGVTIDVTDFSAVQLEHNRRRLGESDAERAVISRSLLDICDTSRYDDASFDAVVAYGGPLSYAFEQAPEAMTGLLRILKPGGVLVASVMSLLGSWRYFLGGVVEEGKLYSGRDLSTRKCVPAPNRARSMVAPTSCLRRGVGIRRDFLGRADNCGRGPVSG